MATTSVRSLRGRWGQKQKPRASASAASPFAQIPITTHTQQGDPGDPINLVFLGSRSELKRSFSPGKWQEADPLSLWSGVKMVWAFLAGKHYTKAPLSSLYVGPGVQHKEDIAFERIGKTVKQRDHVRFWNTGSSEDGQEMWIGSASHDAAVEWNRLHFLAGPTHRISPDIDAERNRVIREISAGGAQDLGIWPRTPLLGINGEGDPYYTDGGVAILRATDRPAS